MGSWPHINKIIKNIELQEKEMDMGREKKSITAKQAAEKARIQHPMAA